LLEIGDLHVYTTTVKVSSRYQIALPAMARHHLKIEAGDQLLVDVQDRLILLLPEPADYVEQLAGLHKEIWAGIDTNVYLNEERNAWTQSTADQQIPGEQR
jgi:AbrB family looped-hinge helix DNA binding protein